MNFGSVVGNNERLGTNETSLLGPSLSNKAGIDDCSALKPDDWSREYDNLIV